VPRDPLAHLVGQVEPAHPRRAPFQLIEHTQPVAVVLEAVGVAVPPHQRPQSLLAGVAEGRVPDVMGEGDGLDQVLVRPQGSGEGLGDLGNGDGVGQPGAVEVAGVVQEDLGAVLEPPEGLAMDDTADVTLEGRAVGALRLGAQPGAGSRVGGREGREATVENLRGRSSVADGWKHGGPSQLPAVS